MARLIAGLQVNRLNPVETLKAIVQAEERGVEASWSTFGGLVPDTLSLLAVAATQTRQIKLGTSIIPTYTRHPTVIAAQALAIEGLAPGRLRLGIGPSHKPTIEDAFGIPMGHPHQHLREYLTVLRQLLWEGQTDFQGEYFKVKTQLPSSIKPPQTPLFIAALRSNAFHLAGELADGAISWVCPVDYLVKTALPALQEGASKASRQVPPLVCHVPVAVSTDQRAVLEAVRKQLGYYGRLPFYARMFGEAGFPVGSEGQMSDELLLSLVVWGEPASIRSRLEEIQGVGMDELLITPVVVTNQDEEGATLAEILASS